MISISRHIGKVSFTGNPIMLGIQTWDHLDSSSNPRPFYTLFCEIFLEAPSSGGAPYETLSINPDSEGKGIFDLAPVLKDLTKPTIAWPAQTPAQAVKDTDARVAFWVRIRDGYGTPFVLKDVQISTVNPYYAIPGGLTDEVLKGIEDGTSNCEAFLSSNKIFFTSIPAKKRVYPTQTELLRFFNWIATASGANVYTLKVKQYLWDGTSTTATPWTGTLDILSIYTFNVTPSLLSISDNAVWWEVWIEKDGTTISEKISYSKNEEKPTNPRLFVMRNSLAGFDTIVATGSRTITAEGSAQTGYVAQQSTVRKWLQPMQTRRTSKNVYKGSLGYFNNDELAWLREFFNSEEKYLFEKGKLEHVMLRNDDFPAETDEPPGKIEIEAVLGSPFTFFF